MPPGEDNRSSQAGPPHREANTSPAPLHASSQAEEDSALPQAGATPPGEDASLSQVSTPHLTPLPSPPTSPGEDASLSQASTPLTPFPSQPTPPGEDASLPQASTPPTPFPPSLRLSCLHRKTGDLLTSLTPKQVNLIIQQTILGKVAGIPQGKAPPGLPGGSYYLPGRQQLHHPLLGIPRVLLRKNLTLSGSLTFPTNP